MHKAKSRRRNTNIDPSFRINLSDKNKIKSDKRRYGYVTKNSSKGDAERLGKEHKRKKKKDEKSVIKIFDPLFSNDKRTAASYRAVRLDNCEYGDSEENEDENFELEKENNLGITDSIGDSGRRELMRAQYLSFHDPLRHPNENAFEMVREDMEEDVEKEKKRQKIIREEIERKHKKDVLKNSNRRYNEDEEIGFSKPIDNNSIEEQEEAEFMQQSGLEKSKDECYDKGANKNKRISALQKNSSHKRDKIKASEDVDTDSDEDIISTYKHLESFINDRSEGEESTDDRKIYFPEIPQQGRRYSEFTNKEGVTSVLHNRKVHRKKSSRGRKRDGIDMKDTPKERVILTEDLWKSLTDSENNVVFSGMEKDFPDLMKENIGNTVRNLNTTIVSPLTVLDNVYVQSSRTPEEIAVIARSNEWDAIQERMKFGKACGLTHEPFVNNIENKEIGEIDDEEDKDSQVKSAKEQEKPGLSVLKSIEELKDSSTHCEQDEIEMEEKIQDNHEGEQVEEQEEQDGYFNDINRDYDNSYDESEDVDDENTNEVEEKEKTTKLKNVENNSIQDKMNSLTRLLIRKEKEKKRIVSDARMIGFDIMMKGSVLEALMFFWLESIQMRPGEIIEKKGEKGVLYKVQSNTMVWNEQEIFSLCSQLVSLQEQKSIYRENIKGLKVKEILEQNPSFGEPCDMNHDECFLRPAVGSERPCRFGNECFLFCIGQSTVFPDTLNRVVNETAFPGREFYRPEELRRYKNRPWPKKRRSCLICYEMAMMYLFLYYRRDNRNPPFVIQNHWNKIEGENAYTHSRMYPLEDNEKRWTGFVLPKVMRSPTSLRASKTYVTVNGELRKIPCYVQASQNFR